MKRILAATTITIASASGAFAQSAPAIEFSGFVQAEGVFDTGSSQFFGFANLDVVVPIGNAFGFELTTKVLAFDGGTLNLTYADLYYEFGNHRISAGLTESAYSQFNRANVLSDFGTFDLEINVFASGSVVDLLQLSSTQYAPGIRYDGAFGDLDVSASFNQDSGGNQVYAAAGEYSFGTIAVSAGVEMVTDGATQKTGYFVALAGETASGEYWLRYSSSAIATGEVLEANYMHHFSDRLSAGVGVMSFNGGATVFTSASAQYTFANNLYVRAGVVNGLGGSGRTLAMAAIGMTF